jgi:rubrerythrin
LEEKMKDETRLGMNRTGMAMAPKEGKKQEENAWKAVPASPGDPRELERLRSEYEAEAEPIGSVPPPASLKGMAKSALQMMEGRDPKAFIDKLGERLAFERGGTRLYELLIGKHRAGESATGEADLETLIRFRNQELAHFRLLWDSLEKLGADPTVQTPSADHTGVKNMGLIQTLSDPRSTFYQGLDAILIAELADNDAWHMLVELAEGMGLKDMAAAFRQASAEEDVHLEQIRKWWSGLVREETGIEEAVAT